MFFGGDVEAAARVDLAALIGADVALHKHAAGELAGPCPFCGGQDKRDADRFVVWPDDDPPRWWCRKCGKRGDAIQYLRERDKLTYAEACFKLGLMPKTTAAERPLLPGHDPVDPPSDDWQARAVTFCQTCEDRLWSSAGARALTWLRDVRGLTDATIKGASLGYQDQDVNEDPAAWGLPAEHKPVWLPRGITLPWVVEGHIWRVNIRRPVGDPKYCGPAGSGNALYGADGLAAGCPGVLVEGELDALTIEQHAGGIARPVATGSTSGARRARWIARLAACSRVLVAYDGDEAGEAAAAWWLGVLPNATRWRAWYGKDCNGLATSGGDVRAWVLAGLGA